MRIEGWGFACSAVVGFLALLCWGFGSVVGLFGLSLNC
jgi:hypothetical protein